MDLRGNDEVQGPFSCLGTLFSPLLFPSFFVAYEGLHYGAGTFCVVHILIPLLYLLDLACLLVLPSGRFLQPAGPRRGRKFRRCIGSSSQAIV